MKLHFAKWKNNMEKGSEKPVDLNKESMPN